MDPQAPSLSFPARSQLHRESLHGHDPRSMRVKFTEVKSGTVRVRPEDCDSRKAVQEGSLSAIQAAFPDAECYVWHDGFWESIDDTTASLVVEGSELKVVRKLGE